MKVTILGSATSTGVPVVGCGCNVCLSGNPRNKRTRTSALVEVEGKNILIDTPPDLHQQAIANRVEKIDAVIYTHAHADHIFGLDELRIFNFLQEGPIPIYGGEKTIDRIKKIFDYIWDSEVSMGGGKPMINAHPIQGEFDLFGIKIQPIEILHGAQIIYGYRIRDFAYLTDCSGIPDSSRKYLSGLQALVLGALRFRPHPTHFCFSQAVSEIQRIQPGRGLLTHLSHCFDAEEEDYFLSHNVELAYDGMEIAL